MGQTSRTYPFWRNSNTAKQRGREGERERGREGERERGKEGERERGREGRRERGIHNQPIAFWGEWSKSNIQYRSNITDKHLDK